MHQYQECYFQMETQFHLYYHVKIDVTDPWVSSLEHSGRKDRSLTTNPRGKTFTIVKIVIAYLNIFSIYLKKILVITNHLRYFIKTIVVENW